MSVILGVLSPLSSAGPCLSLSSRPISVFLPDCVSVSLVPVRSQNTRAPLRPGSLASPALPSPSHFLRIGVLFSDERIWIETHRMRGSALGFGGGSEGGAPSWEGEREAGTGTGKERPARGAQGALMGGLPRAA